MHVQILSEACCVLSLERLLPLAALLLLEKIAACMWGSSRAREVGRVLHWLVVG